MGRYVQASRSSYVWFWLSLPFPSSRNLYLLCGCWQKGTSVEAESENVRSKSEHSSSKPSVRVYLLSHSWKYPAGVMQPADCDSSSSTTTGVWVTDGQTRASNSATSCSGYTGRSVVWQPAHIPFYTCLWPSGQVNVSFHTQFPRLPSVS